MKPHLTRKPSKNPVRLQFGETQPDRTESLENSVKLGKKKRKTGERALIFIFLVDLQRKTVPRNKKQKCAGRWRFLFWFFFWVSLRTCSPSVPAPKKKEKKREKTRRKTRKRFVRQRVRSVVNHSLRLCVGSFSFFFADRNLRPRCRLVSVPNDVGLFCVFFFGVVRVELDWTL